MILLSRKDAINLTVLIALALVTVGAVVATYAADRFAVAENDQSCWRTGADHPRYAEGYRWNVDHLGYDGPDPDYPVARRYQSNICPSWVNPKTPTPLERKPSPRSKVSTRSNETAAQADAATTVVEPTAVATAVAVPTAVATTVVEPTAAAAAERMAAATDVAEPIPERKSSQAPAPVSCYDDPNVHYKWISCPRHYWGPDYYPYPE